jgi:protease PrsW
MNSQPAVSDQPIVEAATQPTTSRKKFSRRKIIKWLLFTTSVLIGLFLLVLILAVDSLEFSPTHLLAGIILATIPVPLYAALILWIDRFEHEPRYLLFLCFLWGGTVSIALALIVNTTVMITSGGLASIVVSAPIIEELGKGAILFLIFFFKRDEFNGILDGIIYAAITALGFAMVENFSYYGRAFAGMLPVGPGAVFFARGVQSPFLHPFFTCMTGIALGWAAQTQNKLIRGVVPLLGLALAMFFHSLWNFSAVINLSNIIYLVLMLPAFLTILIIAACALRREKQIICRQLLTDLSAGRLTRQEYEHLTSLRRRCAGSFRALFGKGLRAWRAQRKCNQAASELAFQRHRASEGVQISAVHLNYCESAFHELLQETRTIN